MGQWIKIWAEAARPKTLWASISPVLMGLVLAYLSQSFNWAIAVLTLLAAILIQIGTNYANDYYDFKNGADQEREHGPRRLTQMGVVSPKAMRNAFIWAFGLAVMCGIFLVYQGGIPILIVGILSILFGILYTAGPYPLGYIGLGDLFVLLFFGPVAVGGTYYLLSMELTGSVLLLGLIPGLFGACILTVNNLRDVETDHRAGKRTLAVRFGKKFAQVEYLFCLLLALSLPLLIPIRVDISPWRFLAIGFFILLLAKPSIEIVLANEGGSQLNKVLAGTGKLLLFHTILLSVGWIW